MPLYIATRRVKEEDLASAKTRQERREIADRLCEAFAADVAREFPNVVVTQKLKSILTLFLELPEDGHEELAKRIAERLDCSIMQNGTVTISRDP